MFTSRWMTLVLGFALVAPAFGLPILPLSEKGGLERLSRSRFNVDFAKLANHYRTQTDMIVCGPTSAAIVLNAIRPLLLPIAYQPMRQLTMT